MCKDNYTSLSIAFGVTLTLLVAGSVWLFRSGHILNGDYALYICQARSLLEGTQHQVLRDMQEMLQLSTYKFYSPTLYPWGFPLMLMLPMALFGINYMAFKLVIILSLLLTLYLLYLHYHREGEHTVGVWVLLFCALNYHLYSATDLLISTLPYLLMLVVTLMCIRRYRPVGEASRQNLLWGATLGCVLFLTLQMRTEGMLLLPALLLYQVVEVVANRKTFRIQRTSLAVLLLPYASLLMVGLVTLPLLPPGFLGHSSHLDSLTPPMVVSNIIYYLTESSKLCFSYFDYSGIGGALFFWAMVVVGICKSLRRGSADVVYCVGHLSLLAVWPYQNARYLLPLLPLLLYFFVKGMWIIVCSASKAYGTHIFNLIQCSMLGMATLFFVLQMGSHNSRYSIVNMDVENSNATAMLDYLNQHTKPTDVIGCCESRTIYLYTGRISCNLFASIYDTTAKADWYVLFRNRGEYLQHPPEVLEEESRYFILQYENEEFAVYKIKKQNDNNSPNRQPLTTNNHEQKN